MKLFHFRRKRNENIREEDSVLMTKNQDIKIDGTFEAESETESSSSLSPSHDDEGSLATKASVLATGEFYSSLSFKTSHVTVDFVEDRNVEVQVAINDVAIDDDDDDDDDDDVDDAGSHRAVNTSASTSVNDENCTNDIELDEEEEVDLKAIALSQKIQNVTPQECQRFLKIRTIEQAEAKLENYKEWRQTYHLDDESYTYRYKHGPMSSSLDDTYTNDDDALWERAIRKSLLSFPPSSHTSDESSSKTGTDNDRNKPSMNADDLIQQMPRFIRMHDHSKHMYAENSPPKSDKKVLHILMNLIDSSIAPLKFYALLIAIYLDLHLDRQSMEDIVTLIDVRKGRGWCNPAPLSMLPFLKETVKHMEYFPERMYRCIVYPVPYPAKFIWHMAKGFLKESMVKRVRLHWGSQATESPVPTSLGKFFDEHDLETFENARVSEFR